MKIFKVDLPRTDYQGCMDRERFHTLTVSKFMNGSEGANSVKVFSLIINRNIKHHNTSGIKRD